MRAGACRHSFDDRRCRLDSRHGRQRLLRCRRGGRHGRGDGRGHGRGHGGHDDRAGDPGRGHARLGRRHARERVGGCRGRAPATGLSRAAGRDGAPARRDRGRADAGADARRHFPAARRARRARHIARQSDRDPARPQGRRGSELREPGGQEPRGRPVDRGHDGREGLWRAGDLGAPAGPARRRRGPPAARADLWPGLADRRVGGRVLS